MFEKEFAHECDTNYGLLNPVVAKNIDYKTPEEGEVIMRLIELAKERNIEWHPSHDSQIALDAYCLRKNIPNPCGGGQAPAYNPMIP